MKNSRMFCITLLKLNSVRALISALFWTPPSDFASNTATETFKWVTPLPASPTARLRKQPSVNYVDRVNYVDKLSESRGHITLNQQAIGV